MEASLLFSVFGRTEIFVDLSLEKECLFAEDNYSYVYLPQVEMWFDTNFSYTNQREKKESKEKVKSSGHVDENF